MNLPKIKATLFSWSGFLIFFICIFTFLNFFRPIEIEDVWWHLKTGEWIVSHLQVPRYDLFPFDHERTPWIFTQWLGSSLLYLVYKFFGLCGLKFFRALFFIGVVLLFFKYAIKKVRFPLVIALILLLLPALYLRSNLRPDIFNYIFIQIFLINLFRFQESPNARVLFLLPLVGILWSNVHLGSFVYGAVLIGIFFLSNIGSPKAKVLAWTLFFYCAGFCVSPYGYQALLYPFKVFLKPDYIHFYTYFNIVEEMAQPLTFFQWHHWYAGFWAIALFCSGLYFLLREENKDERFLHLLLFLCSFCMFLRGVRAGAFFALVASYVIVESLKNTQDLKSIALNKFQKCFWLIVVLLLAIKGFFLYSQADFKNGHFVRDMSLDVDVLNPQSALTFMDRYKLYGQIFNSDTFGGYVLWNSYPRLRPFMDTRDLVRSIQFYRIIQEPQKYWARAVSEFDFKILLLDTQDTHSFSLIRCLNTNDWQLVYYDDASVIFVRRNAFHLPKNILALESQLKNIQLTRDEKEEAKYVLIKDNSNENKILSFLHPKHIDLLDEGKTLLKLGFKQAGIKKLLQAFNIKEEKK